jgi:hypothetical protein
MIQDDKQLEQAVEQLGRMYRALVALRREVGSINSRQFALLAEGPLEEIANLQQQIDEYSGATSARMLQAAHVKTSAGQPSESL